jgi:hypothetical protein
MMDYYDHDERERKQMHHSSGSARIYRTDESGNMDVGGRGNADQGGDVDEGKDEEDKDNEHHDEGDEVLVDLVI